MLAVTLSQIYANINLGKEIPEINVWRKDKMTNVFDMNFNSFAGEERRVRPNRHLRAAWATDCLIIPEGAVELTQGEMSYVDGGAVTYTRWWGFDIRLTNADCILMGNISTAVGMLASIGGVMGGYIGTAIGLSLGLNAGVISLALGMVNKGNGVKIKLSWLKIPLMLGSFSTASAIFCSGMRSL